MIIPILPQYLTDLGGGEYKGLIISLFTITAALSRPFSGKLADTVGRIPVMVFGTSVCFVLGFLYPITTTLWGFFLLRLLHGFSTGFKPTGTSAYVADIVPETRRGEAMGILGIFGSMGMATGPAIGPLVVDAFSINALFYLSSITAILSVLILVGMKETLENKKKFTLGLLKVDRNDVYEPRAKPPSIVLMFTYFGFGALLTLVPDFSASLGMPLKHHGWFFTVFMLSSLVIRLVAGKVSDKYGRVPVLKVSTLLIAVSLALVATAKSEIEFLAYAILFGFGTGMNSPTIFAWTIDLSHPEHRGRAMATMFIALEIGIGVGAFGSGWIYGNDNSRLPLVFYASAVSSFLGFLYLQFMYKPKVT